MKSPKKLERDGATPSYHPGNNGGMEEIVTTTGQRKLETFNLHIHARMRRNQKTSYLLKEKYGVKKR